MAIQIRNRFIYNSELRFCLSFKLIYFHDGNIANKSDQQHFKLNEDEIATNINSFHKQILFQGKVKVYHFAAHYSSKMYRGREDEFARIAKLGTCRM
jgi:hypothetical protein